MPTSVKGRMIKVGNSQGIRIPQSLLEQSGISGNVEIEVTDNQIVITAASRAQTGWAEKFARMSDTEDEDILLDSVSVTTWDEEKWEW
jgi:antitoxin MazE